MPVANGVAISIHASNGRLGEYSIQRQTKFKRVTSYIRVPTPKIKDGRIEQSTFAISICLLREGMIVPYSDQPSDKEANPQSIPVSSHIRKSMSDALPVRPWVQTTEDPNETVAAYIYFDGRAKEEVATLLRPGDETWVNSRWVSVPESEGGNGLAEREFIFKEVGIDKALGGLGLGEKDDAARRSDRADKQHARDKRRQARREAAKEYADRNGIDLEDIPHSSSDESSDDEERMAETAGQIKVVLFRVIATGEVKKGEYSPQFTAADDNEDAMMDEPDTGADLSHTAAFAKPKTLDPATISTQTVQGVDGPDMPFATFTFLYRGDRQLRKMGILKEEASDKTPKRKSKTELDFSNLKPLTPKGTVGFTTRRDQLPNGKKTDFAKSNGKPSKTKKRKSASPSSGGSDSDSDPATPSHKPSPPHNGEGSSDSGNEKGNNDLKRSASKTLSPSESAKLDGIAEGLRKTRLKRQHSAEPENRDSQVPDSQPHSAITTTASSFPPDSVTPPEDLDILTSDVRTESGDRNPSLIAAAASSSSQTSGPGTTAGSTRTPSLSISQAAFSSSTASDEPVIGSPFKRHRTSMDGDGFGGRAAGMATGTFAGMGLFGFGKMGELKEEGTGGGQKDLELGSDAEGSDRVTGEKGVGKEGWGLGFGALLGGAGEGRRVSDGLTFGPPLPSPGAKEVRGTAEDIEL